MVQNEPFSWKNEWSEANNRLYSFSMNCRPVWRDTRTQIDWLVCLRIIDLIMDRQSYSDVSKKRSCLDTMFLNYLQSIGMQKQMTVIVERLFDWIVSNLIWVPQTEFCSMVQNDPFSWKNEWSEANNGLYSFSLNYRPAWRDTRTQIDWVAVDKGLSLWRFITNF